MRRFPALFVTVFMWPFQAQAEDFAESWLQNCLDSAKEDARPKLTESHCIQNVFFVCEYSDAPETCRDGVTQFMKAETTRLISIVPSEFGETEFIRKFYARNNNIVVTGEGLPLCPPDDDTFPGCAAITTSWKYQYARGLAARSGKQ